MNKSSKRMAIALSAAVALTSVLPSAAFADKAIPGSTSAAQGGASIDAGESAPVNAVVSKEKAVELAKQYVSVPDEFKLQSVNLYNRNDLTSKRSVWSLSFVKRVNGKHKGSIDVSIDADRGDLLEFNTYVDEPGAKPSYPLKVNREKAGEVALSFIAKISPKLKDQVRLDADYGADTKPPLNGQVRHSLRFNRMVGELPFVANYIDVDVDSEGRILRYVVNWNEGVKFDQAKPGLTMEQALAKIRQAATPRLVYLLPYQMKEPRKPSLSYEMEPVTLDAVSGEVKQPAGEMQKIAASPVSDKPLGSAPASGKNITREQASQAVGERFAIPAGAAQEGANYNEYVDPYSGETSASWNLDWSLKNGDKQTGSVSASVDSRTGFIRSYSSYMWQEQDRQGAAKIAYESAQAKAVEVVKKQLPWLVHQLYLMEPSEAELLRIKEGQSTTISFRFVRKANDAIVEYDNVRVAIDAYSGEVRDYYADIAPFEYPASAPAVIGREQAVNAWLDYYKLELTYVLETDYVWNGTPVSVEKYNLLVASGELMPGQDQKEPVTKLVYRLVPKPIDEPVFLDALTGQWRNRETGEAASLEKPKAADVEGHWAQRELELMVAYKAIDVVDGKARPNQTITRGELIKMLVLAMNSGRQPMPYASMSMKAAFNDVSAESSYFAYVQDALSQNLIDIGDGSFNPDGKVNREEMAELIVRALGYNSLAEYDELFNVTFADAAKTKQKGQAAIVLGLGIMSLKDGKFVPDREATRAEAATAFFRFLTVRAELKEAPLRNN